MDTLICNKCFSPSYRGKQPYNITQCGHIFCHNCLQQAEKQCPQCDCIGTMYIPLKEPLIPKVAPYFISLADTLELLLRVHMFQNNQMKIIMQRFCDIDKKYEMVKTQYWTMSRNIKLLTNKYYELKAQKEQLEKKILFYEMQKSTPSCTRTMKTMDSGIFTHPSSTGYSSESLKPSKSVIITPMESVDSKKYQNFDNFRIPNKRKSTQSNRLSTSDTNSTHSFLR